jgi:DNA polymerase-1
LYKQFSKRLEAEDSSRLFGEMEMKLISVLSDMELAGVAVDVEMLKELSTDVRKKIDLVTKNIWREAGVEFNLSSSVQLREVLFEKIGLPSEGIKKGKTGLSKQLQSWKNCAACIRLLR